MTRKKEDRLTRIKITGWRTYTNEDVTSSVVINQTKEEDQALTPDMWLMQLRGALSALYRHEKQKLINMNLVPDEWGEGPFNNYEYGAATKAIELVKNTVQKTLRAADVADGEEFNG